MGMFWILVFCLVGQAWPASYDDVEKLLDYLFETRHYRTDIRPIMNQTEPIQVSVAHMLRSIIELNFDESYIRTSSEFRVSWRDDKLTWNASEFDGIDEVLLPAGSFWSPAITVVDAIESISHDLVETRYTPAWVTSEGVVSAFPAESFTSKCDIDSKLFPLDKHMCYIVVMSVKYNDKDIALTSDQDVDILINYDAHPLWDMSNTTIHLSSISKGSHSFRMLVYNITVERRIIFSTFQLWIPLSGMLMLNTISVLVPVESGERLSFSVTVYLAIVIAGDSLMLMLPRHSESVSLSVVTLLLYSLINALTVAWTVLIMCVSRFTGDVPPRLCRLINIKQKPLHHTHDTITTTDEGDLDQGSLNKVNADISESTCVSQVVTWVDVSKRLDKIFLFSCIAFYIILTIMGSTAILVIQYNGTVQ